MALRELWQKLKALTTFSYDEGSCRPISFAAIQTVDIKKLTGYTSQPEPGKACNTCIYYALPRPLDEEDNVPPEPQHDYDEEELINLIKLPIYYGMCTQWMDKVAVLFKGVRSDHGCPNWVEKPVIEQFDDNVIEEDDGRTPVAPTIIGGV